MRKKTWKMAAAAMLTGTVLQAGCLSQRSLNAFSDEIGAALTTSIVNTIEGLDLAGLLGL